MAVYDIGETATLEAVFQTDQGQDFDPDSIVCKVKYPNKTIVEFVYGEDDELVRDSIGHYHVELPILASGVYWYSIIGDDNVEEETFTVRTQKVA